MPVSTGFEAGLKESVVEAGEHRVLEVDPSLAEGPRECRHIGLTDTLILIAPESKEWSSDPVDFVERLRHGSIGIAGGTGRSGGKPVVADGCEVVASRGQIENERPA